MRRTECVREAAVVEALLAPGGLAEAEAGLNEHVRTCGTCTSVVEAASAVLDDERAAVAAARVPSAATVWWRVQLRARREAETRATRPIVVWQGLAAACGLGVLAAAVGFALPSARGLFGWMMASHPVTIYLGLGATLFVVLMPLAFYLAARER